MFFVPQTIPKRPANSIRTLAGMPTTYRSNLTGIGIMDAGPCFYADSLAGPTTCERRFLCDYPLGAGVAGRIEASGVINSRKTLQSLRSCPETQKRYQKVGGKSVPRGLKPGSFQRLCGTAEAVPFQNCPESAVLGQVLREADRSNQPSQREWTLASTPANSAKIRQ